MNEYLRKQLREGRLNKNLKQSDVTKLTGIKNTTLSNYENGVTEPDIDTFLQLCELYELDYAEILGEAYGLSVQDTGFNIKPSEIEIIKKYRELDAHGKDVVDYILDKEFERCSMVSDQQDNLRYINYYNKLASAGSGQILFDDIPTELIAIPDIPQFRTVKYALSVNGRSMEPRFEDGDILLIEPTHEVCVGEIGIFIVDNEAYVKELGSQELISLNKDYPNIPLTEYSKCIGRVVDKLVDK